MRILVTGTRAPVALEWARALARSGHEVTGADTLRWTTASHSRSLAAHHVLPSPRWEPAEFERALGRLLERVDLVLPTCEEVFGVARAAERLGATGRVFAPPMALLARVHHKGDFTALAAGVGARVPRTETVASPEALRDALPRFPRYLAKPAWGRFAVRLATNAGPRAGRIAPGEIRPTEAEPWLVQEFVEGEMECSYSLLHGGRVTAHVAYATPFRHDAGSGVQFVAVDGRESGDVAARLGAATGFTGQMSLDFLRGAEGLVLLECNPRATSGAHLLDGERMVAGLLDPGAAWTQPPGRSRHLFLPLLAAGLRAPRRLARALAAGDDVVADARDPLPALTQLRMAAGFARLARRQGIGLTEATTWDIEWNGAAE